MPAARRTGLKAVLVEADDAELPFGAVAAKSFAVVSATKITAVSPAQGAALHYIYVTTPNGTSAAAAPWRMS